jgi:hypothetical protein
MSDDPKIIDRTDDDPIIVTPVDDGYIIYFTRDRLQTMIDELDANELDDIKLYIRLKDRLQ